jgi:hypothetical protein
MASASVNEATFFTSLNATEMAHRDTTTAGFWNNELKLYSHFPKSLPAHEKEMTKVNDDKPKAWVTMAMAGTLRTHLQTRSHSESRQQTLLKPYCSQVRVLNGLTR